MKTFAAAVFIALLSVPLLAQDLTRSEAAALRAVMTSVDQSRWRFIDALRPNRGSRVVQVRWFNRIQAPETTGPDVYKVWLRTDYAPPLASGRIVVAYSLDQSEWNCRTSQVRYGPSRTYGTDGKPLVSGDDWEEWQTMKPGSVGEAQLKNVCGLIRSGRWKDH
jgi:surface-adhesin protein E